DPPVRLVRGEHDVGVRERASLEAPRRTVEEPPSSSEARLEELRDEIVVVEDAPRAALAEPSRGEMEDVRRVARMDDVHALLPADALGEGPDRTAGGPVLAEVAPRPTSGLAQREPVDGHAVASLYLLEVAALSPRADDGDAVAERDERSRLHPDATIGRHGH